MGQSNAQRTRHLAVGMIVELYLPATDERHVYLWDYCNDQLAQGSDVADNIDKLAQLGRSARWQGSVDGWHRLVRQNSGNPKSLRWAFLQGLIEVARNAD